MFYFTLEWETQPQTKGSASYQEFFGGKTAIEIQKVRLICDISYIPHSKEIGGPVIKFSASVRYLRQLPFTKDRVIRRYSEYDDLAFIIQIYLENCCFLDATGTHCQIYNL